MIDHKVAVVILNWNGEKLLEQFLPSIISFSEEATIYVADNASTDDSISFIQSNYSSVNIIQNQGNYGFAKGYNEALKSVEEPYYALVNSDIEVTENWLRPIIDLFDCQSKIAIIQPKILDFKNKEMFEYAGAAGGFIDKYGYPFCRGRIFSSIEKDHGQYNDECAIFWASGACFFIRKDAYRLLDGFDDTFFAHQEEIDLCWRAFNKGYNAVYCSKSVVYHVGGATLNESNPKKTYLNFRNSLYTLTKNLPKNKLLLVLFSRFVLDGIAGFKFLIEGKFPHCIAIINAHFSYYSNFNSYLRKRGSIQNINYYKTKNIVFKFFLLKKTVFNSIN
jgi:hypothetical protein